jgi:pimeloyl-ACP methyl ester carboxylesterase
MGASLASRFRIVNAVIHAAKWGDHGPRVLMVHGGAQGTSSAGHANFHAQETLGSEGWQLIVPDRPGHGQSPDPGRPDDAEADGEWVAELLGEGAHLVGHSFGGVVALAAVSRRPDAVRSITLIEPALLKIATSDPAVRKTVLGLAATMLLPFSPATRARRSMKLLGIPDVFGRDKAELTELGKSLGRAQLPSKAWMLERLAVVRDHNIPLLAISGDASACFIGTGKATAAASGGKFVIVPSENHFPQWAGASFNKVMSDFWNDAGRPVDGK